jgi:hypothetical protein
LLSKRIFNDLPFDTSAYFDRLSNRSVQAGSATAHQQTSKFLSSNLTGFKNLSGLAFGNYLIFIP